MALTMDWLGARLGALVNRQRVLVYSTIALVVVLAEYAFVLSTGTGLLDRFGQVKGTDFVEFYVAGRLVGAGRGALLYQFVPPFRFPAQFAAEARVLAPQVSDPTFAFVVPPFYALPFVPLAALPYLQAYTVWLVLDVALLLATLRLLRPHVTLLQGPDRRLVYLVAASFFPVLECLFDGQNAILSLFLFAAAYVALRGRRDALAGVALGLALYKPQLVLVMALFLLVGRRRDALLGLAGTALALVGVSGAIVGAAGIRDYLTLSLTMPGWVYLPGWRTWNMHSLNSFFVLLVADPTLSRALAAIASLAVIGLAILAWRAEIQTDTHGDVAEFNRQFALAVLATVLVSPHVFAYDLALLLLPGLLLADAIVAGQFPAASARGPWLRALLALGYLSPLFSRFAAMQVGFQPSVLVVAALFAVTLGLKTEGRPLGQPERALAVVGEN
jgi:hypothetical protein